MQRRRLLAFLLLALTALPVAGALVDSDECDDVCPPDCGDCIGCGLVAVESPIPRILALLGVSEAQLPPAVATTAGPLRQLDHVPLAPVA